MNYKQLLSCLQSDHSDFILNILNIEDFRINSHSQYRFFFNHIRENINSLNGDIFEFGVYRGSSLIATALLLKSIGSNKHVYGFDSFSGFPVNIYHENDDLNKFSDLTYFEPSIYNDSLLYQQLRGVNDKDSNSSLDVVLNSLGSAGTFSANSFTRVQELIHLLELDNITIIDGSFSDTIPQFVTDNPNLSVSAANIDCDLYQSYCLSLDFISRFLTTNGFVHLDEYYSLKYPGARIAVDEFIKSVPDNTFELCKYHSITGEFPRYALKRLTS